MAARLGSRASPYNSTTYHNIYYVAARVLKYTMNVKQKLLKNVHVSAHGDGYAVIAMNNDYNKSQVVGHLKGVTGEELSVEHRGSYNKRNDEWRVTF